MDKTKIQWTDATWNPVTGCSKVSSGCKNCYAEAVAGRWWGERKFTDVQTHADRLDQPLRWRRPRRVFVNSMSDLFHDAVPDAFIDRVFAVMALAPRHTFQVLTKRPGRMRDYMGKLSVSGSVESVVQRLEAAAQAMGVSDEGQCQIANALYGSLGAGRNVGWPMRNVWLGVSVEDQRAADERIPLLLQTPAAVRFLSCEPLLSGVDLGLRNWVADGVPWAGRWVRLTRPVGPDLPELVGTKGGAHIADAGVYRAHANRNGALAVETPGGRLGIKPDEFTALPTLDWVIAGGESGPGARPCDVAWIRSIVEQCKAAGVPAFVKQLGAEAGIHGGNPPLIYTRHCGFWHGDQDGWIVRMKDRKGGDPSEWPEDLRVREFPAVEARS